MTTINPYLKRIPRRKTYSAGEYVSGILKGNITLLSQAVTLVESAKQEHKLLAQQLIERCLPYSGKSIRIGITGVPGAGKSSLIDILGMYLIGQGHKVAVLAIDPSSERTKGSILGDKTRMEALSHEKNAFIRPSPSAGTLGGVARKTHDTVVLCEAAGYDTIFIETVGVGQSETAVHSMVDFFLLIQLTGAGDELQGIKRGIMEMADGIIVNKADGDNLQKAQLAAVNFRNILHLFQPADSGKTPAVLTCSKYNVRDIKEVWDMIHEYITFTKANGYFDRKRNEQAKYRMHESLNNQLHDVFYHHPKIAKQLPVMEQKVLNNEISSFHAAQQLIEQLFNYELRITNVP